MKKKCEAISSKKPYKICKRNALSGSKYCWLHFYQLKQSISFFMLGILITFNSIVWYDFFTVSNEEKTIWRLKSDVERLGLNNNELRFLTNSLEETKRKNETLINEKEALTLKVEVLNRDIAENKVEIKQVNEKLKTIKINDSDDHLFKKSQDETEKYTLRVPIEKQYENAFFEFKRNNYSKAKKDLELILEKDPNHLYSLNLLAAILSNMGKGGEAIKLLNHAYSISRNKSILENIEMLKKYPNKKIGYDKN